MWLKLDQKKEVNFFKRCCWLSSALLIICCWSSNSKFHCHVGKCSILKSTRCFIFNSQSTLNYLKTSTCRFWDSVYPLIQTYCYSYQTALFCQEIIQNTKKNNNIATYHSVNVVSLGCCRMIDFTSLGG